MLARARRTPIFSHSTKNKRAELELGATLVVGIICRADGKWSTHLVVAKH
jgi:hypothetical protein